MYITVNLPEYILAIAEEQVASGRAETIDQYIRGLIIQDRNDQRLHEVIMQEMQSDPEVQEVQAYGEQIINERQLKRWNSHWN